MKKILLTGIYLIVFSLQHLLHAQNFRYTQYTTNEGLPSDNVYCAAQDNHGFIYFGTDFGLVKYDGFRFSHYSNKEGLINKPITDMVYAGGDSIIFAAYPDALQSIHADGRIDTIINKAELGFSIQQIEKHNNSFYIYQRTLPNYAILEGNKLTKIKLDILSGIPGIIINCITSISKTQLIFCTNKGVFIMNDGHITTLLPGVPAYRALLKRNNQLLIAGDKKIYQFDTSLHMSLSPFQLPTGFNTLHMEEDNSSAVWFRGLDKGVLRLTDKGITDLAARFRMENYAINEFYKDNDGSFWICTSGAGILLISKNQAEIFSTQEGLINNKIQRLLALPGQLLIGTQNGLSIKKGNLITSPSIPRQTDALQYVHRLFKVSPKITGVCMANTIAFDADTSKITGLVKDQLIDGNRFRFFNSIFAWQENDSIAWLHKSRGSPLIRVNILNNRRSFYDIKPFAIRKFFIMVFFDSCYWLSSDNGILQLKNNQFRLIDNIHGEKLKQVMDMKVDSKKQLWLATENGLYKNSNDQFDSLPKVASYGGNYCTSLTEDDKGYIWVATWDGIFNTNGQQRNYYNNSSGLSSRIVNTILFDKTEKKLYVGTDNGLTVFPQSPEKIGFTQTVFIQASLGNATKTIIKDSIVLQPSQNDLSFYLTVPYYDGHEEIVFEYNLDNNEWVQQKNPQLNFTNLSGGHHTLRVRPRINNLNLTGTESVFHFQIETPFYKKGWFIIASLLLIQLLIIIILNHFNKKKKEKEIKQQLRQQQQMLEHASLKQQAFTSLLNPHFIFNALNSIQHFINQQDRQNANRYLSDFASLIRKTFDASQQTFIPLEAEQENLRLYLQLEKMRFGDKINYSITNAEDLDTDNWMLPAMILQPFLENAILHGLMPATNNGELQIHFAQNQQHELVITIADNGIGFEKSRQLRTGKTHTSRGMQLIKERLELLGKLSGHTIKLSIADQYPGAENPGTVVTLCYSEEVYDNYMKLQQ